MRSTREQICNKPIANACVPIRPLLVVAGRIDAETQHSSLLNRPLATGKWEGEASQGNCRFAHREPNPPLRPS